MYDINNGEKKIMNNNPTVANVNLVHDIVGEDGDKSLGFKVIVGVLTTLMMIIGAALILNDRVLTGIIIIIIGLTLLFTSIGFKYKRKKYIIDEKIVDDIEPIFKDHKKD